ncbi:MAG: hypothetical protein ABIP39_11725 [Polyangiaceae bacterium]
MGRFPLLGLDGASFLAAHVGPAWFHGRLAILRADATELALVDPTTGDVGRVPLSPPASNLELGGCFTIEREGRPFLVAFGAHYVFTLRFTAPRMPQMRIVPWSPREVRAVTRSSGGVVRLFGEASTCDLALEPLLAELDDADAVTTRPTAMATYELGEDAFLGASACGDEVFFLAGQRLGVLDPTRFATLEDLRLPALGLAIEPTNRRRAYVLTSEELLTIDLA